MHCCEHSHAHHGTGANNAHSTEKLANPPLTQFSRANFAYVRHKLARSYPQFAAIDNQLPINPRLEAFLPFNNHTISYVRCLENPYQLSFFESLFSPDRHTLEGQFGDPCVLQLLRASLPVGRYMWEQQPALIKELAEENSWSELEWEHDQKIYVQEAAALFIGDTADDQLIGSGSLFSPDNFEPLDIRAELGVSPIEKLTNLSLSQIGKLLAESFYFTQNHLKTQAGYEPCRELLRLATQNDVPNKQDLENLVKCTLENSEFKADLDAVEQCWNTHGGWEQCLDKILEFEKRVRKQRFVQAEKLTKYL